MRKIIFIFWGLLCGFLLQAQENTYEMTILSIEESPQDLTALVNKKYDNNNNLCAAVKVYIPVVRNISFSGFVIDGGVSWTPGEYLVYVAVDDLGRTQLRYRHANYLPGIIDFKAFGIQLTRGSTYIVKMKAPINVQNFHSVAEVWTERAENVFLATAELTGSVSDVGEISSIGFYYGTNPDSLEYFANADATDLKGSFKSSIKNLSPGTIYYYKAGVSSYGEVAYGEVKSFSTKPFETMLTVADTVSINSNSAILEGQYDVSDDYAKFCYFGFFTGIDPDRMIASGDCAIDINGSFQYQMNKLLPATKYYYAPYMKDISTGRTYRGKTSSFTTLGRKGPIPQGAIDLGLASGTLWAGMNIGAERVEEYGEYFSWGEIKKKSIYTEKEYAFPFDILSLNSDNDVATSRLGEGWHIPSAEQIKELMFYCKWEWVNKKKNSGYIVTGPNGNSIFIPAAGFCNDHSKYDENAAGYYWSSDSLEDNTEYAKALHFLPQSTYNYNAKKFIGFPVRAVTQ